MGDPTPTQGVRRQLESGLAWGETPGRGAGSTWEERVKPPQWPPSRGGGHSVIVR